MGGVLKSVPENMSSNLDQNMVEPVATQPTQDSPTDKQAEYKEVFNFFDKDQNGSITAAELKQVLKNFEIEIQESTLQEIMKKWDQDGDGELQFEEFVQVIKTFNNPSGDLNAEIKAAFKAFDLDGDGFITLKEVKNVMKKLGQNVTDEDAQRMITQADKDGNDKIDFDEFLAMMISQSSNQK